MLLWYIWECYNVIMYNILWICIGKVTIPSTCTSNVQCVNATLIGLALEWTQFGCILYASVDNSSPPPFAYNFEQLYTCYIYTYRILLKEVNIYICIYTINLIWKSDTCIIINTHFEIQTCDDMVTLNPNLNLKPLFTLYV